MRFLSSLILCTFLTNSISNPLSALNDNSSTFFRSVMAAFQGKQNVDLTQFLSSFEMPPCLRRCVPDMASKIFEKNLTIDSEHMQDLCLHLDNSTKCATKAGCSHVFTDAMANAYQFMCIDNINEMSTSLACIKNASSDIQQICERVCQVQGTILDKASKNEVDDVISVENMCNSTSCLVRCFHENLSKQCELHEKNILNSIMSVIDKKEDHGFDDLLSWIMPSQCKDEMENHFEKNSQPTDKPLAVGNVAKHIPTTTVSVLDEELQRIVVENSTILQAQLTVKDKEANLQCQLLDLTGKSIEDMSMEQLVAILADKYQLTSKKIKKSVSDEMHPETASPSALISLTVPLIALAILAL